MILLARNTRGTAAVEFALVCALLLTMLGGLVDFGLMLWSKNRLASGVAAGAQYAFNTWPSVSASSTAQYQAAIQSVVQGTSSLPSATVAATLLVCYCISADPAALASSTCQSTCPDGTAPGTYVVISASYVYQPVTPYYSKLASPTLQESATARLQ